VQLTRPATAGTVVGGGGWRSIAALRLSGASGGSLRERLGSAALALLLVPAAAAAADAKAANQLDFTTLFYGEQGRTQVLEPIVRATRLFANGQSLSARLTVDSITGASPTGALPTGSVQTITSPSGRVSTIGAGEIPLAEFEDQRVGLDGEWRLPFGKRFASSFGLHASREQDYQSLGADGKLSLELMQRMVTLTVGAGAYDDSSFPFGGTPIGLTDGSVAARNQLQASLEPPVHTSRILSGAGWWLSTRHA
jgi:hypothetical protein